jgi:hypothetical protein
MALRKDRENSFKDNLTKIKLGFFSKTAIRLWPYPAGSGKSMRYKNKPAHSTNNKG